MSLEGVIIETTDDFKNPSEVFEINDVNCDSVDDFNSFYIKFSSVVLEYIRSRHDVTHYFNNSQHFYSAVEDVIVLWCLERIDPRLPKQVKETFGSHLNDDVSLKDLRKDIFSQVTDLKDQIQDVKAGDNKTIQCKQCAAFQHDKIRLMEHVINDHPDPILPVQKVEIVEQVNGDHTQVKKEAHPQQTEKSFHMDPVSGQLIENDVEMGDNDDEHDKEDQEDQQDEEQEQKLYDRLNDDDFIDDSGEYDDFYECSQCDKTFSTKAKLIRHSKRHKGSGRRGSKAPPEEIKDPHPCEICNKVFSSNEDMVRHIQIIHKKEHRCEICDVVLPNIVKYFQHMNEHKTGRKRKEYIPRSKVKLETDMDPEERKVRMEQKCMCDICGKELACPSSLASHKKWHQKKCDKCQIEFADRRTYLVHMRIHKPKDLQEKTATCEKCGQAFASKYNLIAHRKTHEGKLHCATCKRSFYEEKDLKSHVCKHYSCDLCEMKFMRLKNLKMHEKMHAGEVIYSCDLCEALFAKMKRLTEHRRSIHLNGSKKYKCEHCPKAFNGKSQLVKHSRTHTGEKPFKCSQCDMAFNQKGNLDTHFKLHTNEFPFECVGCQGRYRSTGALKSHRESKMCGFTTEDQITI